MSCAKNFCIHYITVSVCFELQTLQIVSVLLYIYIYIHCTINGTKDFLRAMLNACDCDNIVSFNYLLYISDLLWVFNKSIRKLWPVSEFLCVRDFTYK